jgi:hypothetical protein
MRSLSGHESSNDEEEDVIADDVMIEVPVGTDAPVAWVKEGRAGRGSQKR